MAVKLEKRLRWLQVRNYIHQKYGIEVNFSNRHSNYYTAWLYTTKDDSEYIKSEGHPDITDPITTRATETRMGRTRGRSVKNKVRRKAQLTIYEVSEIAVHKGIKTRLELLALANKQKQEGKIELAQFIANRGSKAVAEAIRVGWDMKNAEEMLQRSRMSRIELLINALASDCANGCEKNWLLLALNILHRNGISVQEFSSAILHLLQHGRGKYRNVLVKGPSNCGKTFLLNPLTVIYNTFSNPATSSFAWLGVESSEVIFLNDFRWSPQIIPWHNLLLLLEGQTVHFPAPKTHYSEDIVFDKDSPIFCTSKEHFSFVKGGVVDEVETEMMRVRWRTFSLFCQIPVEEQIDAPSCSRCFAELIISNA